MSNFVRQYLKANDLVDVITPYLGFSKNNEQILDFNKIIPVPEDNCFNIYEWCCKNWGCYSNSSEFDVKPLHT